MKTAKTKLKNCTKSYPCGNGCISRRFNCRKKLAGQASNYAEREKKIKANTPSNQLQAFTRPSTLDREIFKVSKAKQELSDSLNSFVQKNAENRIVPFKKRRSQDFSESPDNFFQQYNSLKEQLKAAIANLELQLRLFMMNNA